MVKRALLKIPAMFVVVLAISCSEQSKLQTDAEGLVDLSGNTFNEIPCICDEQPKELVLKNCEIRTFGKCFVCLNELEILNLSNNDIQYIPDDITELKKLRILGLNNNDLRQVNFKIAELTQLERLYILGNHIPNNQIDSLKSLMPWCDVKGYIVN